MKCASFSPKALTGQEINPVLEKAVPTYITFT